VWLGATLGCAECHDHKFDPYTARDFYRFGAFFADIQEKAVGRQDQTKIPSAEQQQKLARLTTELVALQTKLTTDSPELQAGQAKWEVQAVTDLAANRSNWTAIKPDVWESKGKQTFTLQDDLSLLASGENPAKDTYTITLPLGEQSITGLRLEALTHDSLAGKSLSRANGNFVLTEVDAKLVAKPGEKPTPVKLAAAIADFSQPSFPIDHTLDGKPNTGWAVSGHEKPANHVAVFTLAAPLQGAAGATLIITMKHESAHGQHNVGCFRWSLTSLAQPTLEDRGGVPANIATVLAIAKEQRSAEQQASLAQHYRTFAPELADVRQQVAALKTQQQALEAAAPQTLVSQAIAPRMVRILPRGNWLSDEGEVVEPGVPGFLPQLAVKDRRATRLDLAQWMVAPENPLVARVFVNRLWKLMFGHGLARNMEDYGSQGSVPSHPELLDELALDFRENGWNVRRLLKQMVMSNTYRQSSRASAAVRGQDPMNEWLARQDRFRLDAEFIRDNALAVSGLLARPIGGPSVKPYQPAGYWQFLNFPQRTYQHDQGDNLYRRGMYTYWQRSFVNPSLLAFDAPSREECTNERPRSNTPVQALALLNDPTYVEAARALASKALQEGGDTPAARIEFAFRRAVARPATPEEVKLLTALYQKHLTEYTAEPMQAAQVSTNGESRPAAATSAAELAAWTSVMRVILNLHETVTRS
ncbi:MAG TPA: DUF1553 domain-containing protein, partial [Pirellulaceae bacterium]|nr:DUF1553 domain-containing protein [Pirellulaceae bacterium]